MTDIDERHYPIYSFTFRWTQNGDETDSTGFSQMFREEQKQESLEAFAAEWWGEFIQRDRPIVGKLIDKNPRLTSSEAKYVEHEAWCLAWFQHYTYNTHLTDEELRRSFWHYVDRKHDDCRKRGDFEGHGLMGAVDTWRWKAPCRCEHCQARGIVMIDH